MKILRSHFRAAIIVWAAAGLAAIAEQPQAPFTDYRREQPGAVRKITLADLPQPYGTQSADNHPHLVPRPADAWPKALPGLARQLFGRTLNMLKSTARQCDHC